MIGPGFVKHTGKGHTAIHGNFEHPHVSLTKNLFNVGNILVDVVEDLDSIVWGKLIINAAINPLTALLQLTNEELATSKEAVEIVKKK